MYWRKILLIHTQVVLLGKVASHSDILKPIANGRNIEIVGQQLWALLDVICYVRCHTLLNVVVVRSCCAKFETRSNFSANNYQHFFCSVIANASRNNVGPFGTALLTLLGPRTRIKHSLQRLMGCILPTMHCRSQHCWKLLHQFAQHRQHGRNNCQHCWPNNIGSCTLRPSARCFRTSSRVPGESNGDQNQFSPNNIHTWSRGNVTRINKMITKGQNTLIF